MNILVFNSCVALGWLMLLAGGLLLNVGWGLVGGGFSLLALTVLVAKLAGFTDSGKKQEKNEASS